MFMMRKVVARSTKLQSYYFRHISWGPIFVSSALWGVMSFLSNSHCWGGFWTINVAQIFSPQKGNILRIVLSYLTYGLPMMITISYLHHPVCEEYVYIRCRNRIVISISSLIPILTINTISIMTMIFSFLVMYSYSCPINIKFEDLNTFLLMLLRLSLSRNILAIILSMFKIIKLNLTALFIFISSLCFANIILNEKQNYSLLMYIQKDFEEQWMQAIFICLLLAFVIACRLCIDLNRDIAVVEE